MVGNGVLRGCGKQRLGTILAFGSFGLALVIGSPLTLQFEYFGGEPKIVNLLNTNRYSFNIKSNDSSVYYDIYVYVYFDMQLMLFVAKLMFKLWQFLCKSDKPLACLRFCVLIWCIQYIPRNMHTVFALLCFVVVIHWLIFPYPSGLLHWHCGNLTIAPVPAKQP